MINEVHGRQAAERFRDDWGLGLKPIDDMARLIERTMGIGVACVACADAPGHGMTMSVDGFTLIAVGCTDHPMRIRSTLAHVLGHLSVGSVDRYLCDEAWSDRTPEELQADAFARHLLLPIRAVTAAATGKDITQALLSDLVQTYRASPQIVAIQLREATIINQAQCSEWSSITTTRLAAQFGWRAEYQLLVEQARRPRAPQALLARAIEGYRRGLVTSATIARLEGTAHASVTRQLAADGIVPIGDHDMRAQRPKGGGRHLTPEELDVLQGRTTL